MQSRTHLFQELNQLSTNFAYRRICDIFGKLISHDDPARQILVKSMSNYTRRMFRITYSIHEFLTNSLGYPPTRKILSGQEAQNIEFRSKFRITLLVNIINKCRIVSIFHTVFHYDLFVYLARFVKSNTLYGNKIRKGCPVDNHDNDPVANQKMTCLGG